MNTKKEFDYFLIGCLLTATILFTMPIWIMIWDGRLTTPIWVVQLLTALKGN